MKSCAFTGHRPKSFPWKYDESADACLHLKEILTREIVKLIDCGVTDFYSGLAEGVDYEKRKVMQSEVLDTA